MARRSLYPFALLLTLASCAKAELECAIGWVSGTHKVSDARINDGYCDCPMDGADEPNTDACSGSMVGAWSGIPAVSQEGKKYQCPQQKKLQIPYSRFRDGICDCCDGSDELPGACPDICEQVLAEERALREKLKNEFSIGNALRKQQIADFEKIVKEKQSEKVRIDEQLEQAQHKLKDVKTELYRTEYEYTQQRISRVAELTKQVSTTAGGEGDLVGLLEPLTNDEIVDFIVHSCQMAGEMDRAKDLDESTCVPLRLAGLDTALLWGVETDGEVDLKRLDLSIPEEGWLLADLLANNARAEKDEDKHFLEENSKRKKKRFNKSGRRRLQEINSDDQDEYDDLHDDYLDDFEDDPAREQTDSGDEDTVEEEAEKTILDGLKESIFSQPRIAFLQRSEEIIKGIDELLKEEDDSDKKEDDSDKKEDEESTASTPSSQPSIDPVAYNMVKSTLKSRQEAIERGYDYAVSATEMVTALRESTPELEQFRQDLFTLSVGTLIYGKLSAAHVWQIFQAILPEFNKETQDPNNQGRTCATSPWAAKCPPQAAKRGTAALPPKSILQAGAILCTTPTFTNEKAQACAADADDNLPTVMPDGYRGYEEVHPREDGDVLEKISNEWDSPMDEDLKDKLADLESKRADLAKEKKEIEKALKSISDVVDGAKENRFGYDGELYALKDECYSLKAGKYVYEVCIFGSAAQKEGDSESGTNLGKWSGAEYDEESAQRILKWTDGMKCWNGPKRSATAYVTCGAETKVLSADEPDTCRYVLQMESHVACDDDFKQLHEL